MGIKQMKIAIMISGRGSNLQSLIRQAHRSNVEIVVVAANTPCGGLEIASQHKIRTELVDRADYDTRTKHENMLAGMIETAAPDWIFLAGYMAVLSAEFISRFDGRIVNIHPSLLPDFKGLNTHQRAIDADVERHGATIHLVTPKLDDGAVIAQASLPRHTEDAGMLAAQVLQIEHLLFPAVPDGLATGRLSLDAEAIQDQQVNWHDTASLVGVAEAGFQITYPSIA